MQKPFTAPSRPKRQTSRSDHTTKTLGANKQEGDHVPCINYQPAFFDVVKLTHKSSSFCFAHAHKTCHRILKTCPSEPSPVVAHTCRLEVQEEGDALDWDSFRSACRLVGHPPASPTTHPSLTFTQSFGPTAVYLHSRTPQSCFHSQPLCSLSSLPPQFSTTFTLR